MLARERNGRHDNGLHHIIVVRWRYKCYSNIKTHASLKQLGRFGFVVSENQKHWALKYSVVGTCQANLRHICWVIRTCRVAFCSFALILQCCCCWRASLLLLTTIRQMEVMMHGWCWLAYFCRPCRCDRGQGNRRKCQQSSAGHDLEMLRKKRDYLSVLYPLLYTIVSSSI